MKVFIAGAAGRVGSALTKALVASGCRRAPGNLEEKTATGKVKFNVQHSQPDSLNDVAQVLADVLDKPNTYKKIIRNRLKFLTYS